jgi:hypothetical protein
MALKWELMADIMRYEPGLESEASPTRNDIAELASYITGYRYRFSTSRLIGYRQGGSFAFFFYIALSVLRGKFRYALPMLHLEMAV